MNDASSSLDSAGPAPSDSSDAALAPPAPPLPAPRSAPASSSPPSPLRDLLGGSTAGLVAVIRDVSLASLVFSGPLAGHLLDGAGMALACALVLRLAIAIWSSQSAVIASLEDAPAAIFAAGVFAALLAMPQAAPEAQFATAVVFAALAAAVTGLFFLLLGVFRLGYLVRFVPYPVIGGFMAGIGWLIVNGSFRVMTGCRLDAEGISRLCGSGSLCCWLPGAAMACLLLVLTRLRKHYLILPGVLLAGLAAFYLVLLAGGISLADAHARGWLMGPFQNQPIWRPHLLGAFSQVRWDAIWPQASTLAIVPLISVLSLLLNASGLELASRRDVDLNRELRVAGLGNLGGALVGGFVGYQSMSMSVLARDMGGRGRLAGVAAAGVAGVFLLAGPVLLNFLPRAILGGLLLYLGVNLLIRCLVTSRRQLPKGDYLVLLLIVLVVAGAGFVQGVAAGIFAAVILFVVRSSRASVVKRKLSGADRRSTVDRPPEHRRELERLSDHVTILQLAGYLFFGTSFQLLQQVRQRLEERGGPALHYLVLDFRLVSGIDSSAVFSFVRMRQMAETAGFWMVLTGLGQATLHRMRRAGLIEEGAGAVQVFDDLDHGVEWVENSVLAGRPLPPPQSASLREALARVFGPEADLEQLGRYLQRVDVPVGAVLIRQGEAAEDMFFIESGKVTVRLALSEGGSIRLRTMQAGTVVGEIGYYLGQPRTASVVAAEATVAWRLGGADLEQMARRDPQTAAAFHKYMARLLAERLAEANRHLRAMSE